MGPQLREQLVLKAQRVDVVPAVLDSDSSADVDQGQVVVEDLAAERDGDDEPTDERAAEDQEPTETNRPKVGDARPGDGLAPLRQGYRFAGLAPDVLRLPPADAMVHDLLHHSPTPPAAPGPP